MLKGRKHEGRTVVGCMHVLLRVQQDRHGIWVVEREDLLSCKNVPRSSTRDMQPFFGRDHAGFRGIAAASVPHELCAATAVPQCVQPIGSKGGRPDSRSAAGVGKNRDDCVWMGLTLRVRTKRRWASFCKGAVVFSRRL